MMAQPIYVLFVGKSTEAWHQLSEDEQGNLFDKVKAALEQAGGKNIVACDSAWASEQWQFFGVHEFPDIEAVQKHTAALQALNWFRYVDSITTLGTRFAM
jgi:hypothetical protein